jgi:hypothetical protein
MILPEDPMASAAGRLRGSTLAFGDGQKRLATSTLSLSSTGPSNLQLINSHIVSNPKMEAQFISDEHRCHRDCPPCNRLEAELVVLSQWYALEQHTEAPQNLASQVNSSVEFLAGIRSFVPLRRALR